PAQRFLHLQVYCFGDSAMPHVLATGLGLNSEAWRHRQPGIGHLGEAGAFAAEFIFHFAVAVGFAIAEEINILGSIFRRALAAFLDFSFWKCRCSHMSAFLMCLILKSAL